MGRVAERVVQEVDELVAAANAVPPQGALARLAGGQMTNDELRIYLTRSYQVINELPRFVAAAFLESKCSKDRRALVQLLAAIDTELPTPTERWLQMCAALGLFSTDLQAAPVTPGAQRCIDAIYDLCRRGCPEGMTTIYVYLARRPATAAIEHTALTTQYGLREAGPGVEYFDVAKFLAKGLANSLRSTLVKIASRSEADGESIRAAGQEALSIIDTFHSEMEVTTHA